MTTTQTSAIPFYDFGGAGPLLHFAHANAYPPGSYRQFAAPFLGQYRVLGIEHRPMWPNAQPNEVKTWDQIADDLIAFLEEGDEDADAETLLDVLYSGQN